MASFLRLRSDKVIREAHAEWLDTFQVFNLPGRKHDGQGFNVVVKMLDLFAADNGNTYVALAITYLGQGNYRRGFDIMFGGDVAQRFAHLDLPRPSPLFARSSTAVFVWNLPRPSTSHAARATLVGL